MLEHTDMQYFAILLLCGIEENKKWDLRWRFSSIHHQIQKKNHKRNSIVSYFINTGRTIHSTIQIPLLSCCTSNYSNNTDILQNQINDEHFYSVVFYFNFFFF